MLRELTEIMAEYRFCKMIPEKTGSKESLTNSQRQGGGTCHPTPVFIYSTGDFLF
jgi:hypothetical protein